MTTPQLPDLDLYDHFFGFARGTTGGEGGPIVTCKTGPEIVAAMKGRKAFDPLNIYCDGEIAMGPLTEIEIKDDGNITLMGDGKSKTLEGFGVKMMRASNVILFNLSIGKVNKGTKDAIGMETDCERIVALQCDLYGDMKAGKDTFDGLFDGKRGTQNYAIVLCAIHDHHKCLLQGYSDGDTKPDNDRFFTMALNHAWNCGSRLPSQRYGFGHIWGNLFEDIETSVVNLRMGAVAAVEKNTFIRCKNPVMGDMSKTVGKWNLIDNLMQDVTWGKDEDGEDSDNAQDGKSTTDYYPPYRMPNWTREQCAAFAREFAGLLPPGKALVMPGASDQPAPEQPQQPVEEQPAPIEEPPAAEPDPVEQPGGPETPAEPEQPAPVETEEPAEAEALLDKAEDALMNLRVILAKLAAEPQETQPPVSDPAGLLALIDGATAELEKLPETKPRKNALDYMRKGRDQAEKALRG